MSGADNTVEFECTDMLRFTNNSYYGNWVNKHPLEVIEKLLLDHGVPAEFIDADTFDPTHADYADIAHYVVTYWDLIRIPMLQQILHRNLRDYGENYYGPSREGLPKGTHSETFHDIVHDLARLLIGSLYFQEDGKIRFVRFDTGASVVENWDEDDIRKFEQGETIMINQLEVKMKGGRVDEESSWESNVLFKDATSQSNFNFPGETNGVFSESASFLGLNYHGEMEHTIQTTGTTTINVHNPWGFCGSRVNGNTYSSPWEDMQDSETLIDGSHPLFIMINDEVIKVIAMTLVEDQLCYVYEFDEAGTKTTREMPKVAIMTLVSGNRGQYGTTAATHTDMWDADEGSAQDKPQGVYDVTMQVAFANNQLNRFSNGCPIVMITTDLSHWNVQVGDLVSFENDRFLTYGFDGMSTTHKWEVIGKELVFSDEATEIRWELAYATQASPIAINATYEWIPEDIRRGVGTVESIRYASEGEVGVSRHVVNGLEISSSGLNVTMGAGVCGVGSGAVPFQTAQTKTVAANKDHYFTMDLTTGNMAVQTVTTGAAQPVLAKRSVELAKVVAGASSCTITDQRSYGAVRPRNISTTDFEAGGNLIPNPDFETWSRGSGYPPDNWFMQTLDWIDDGNREETTTYSGNYSVNLSGQYATLMSDPFRVERNRVYQVGAATKPSAGSGITLTVGIRWLDKVKATISNEVMFTHTGNTTLTRNDVFTVAPDTAVYASAYCINSHAVDGLYDAFRMVRAMPSFFATNSSQVIGKEASNVIGFDEEIYDYGGSYTHGTATFTAPFAGTYQFSAQILDVTNDDSDSFISLYKNGSLWLRSSWGNGHQINSGPVALAAGDTVKPYFYNDYNGTAEIIEDATKCWFSGAQIA